MATTKSIKKPSIEKVCPICNTKFISTSKNQKYCSKECSIIASKEKAKEHEKSSSHIETHKTITTRTYYKIRYKGIIYM